MFEGGPEREIRANPNLKKPTIKQQTIKTQTLLGKKKPMEEGLLWVDIIPEYRVSDENWIAQITNKDQAKIEEYFKKAYEIINKGDGKYWVLFRDLTLPEIESVYKEITTLDRTNPYTSKAARDATNFIPFFNKESKKIMGDIYVDLEKAYRNILYRLSTPNGNLLRIYNEYENSVVPEDKNVFIQPYIEDMNAIKDTRLPIEELDKIIGLPKYVATTPSILVFEIGKTLRNIDSDRRQRLIVNVPTNVNVISTEAKPSSITLTEPVVGSDQK